MLRFLQNHQERARFVQFLRCVVAAALVRVATDARKTSRRCQASDAWQMLPTIQSVKLGATTTGTGRGIGNRFQGDLRTLRFPRPGLLYRSTAVIDAPGPSSMGLVQ